MPTAAKLVAALAFAVIGWLVAKAYGPHVIGVRLPDGFAHMNAIIGALVGWFSLGPEIRRPDRGGMVRALGTGLRTSVVHVFTVLLLFSIWEMVGRAFRKLYKGPMDAFIGIFDLMGQHALAALTQPSVLAPLIIGGALAGILAEMAGRRWS